MGKSDANEFNESLLSNCRGPQILCKDTLNICNLQTFKSFFIRSMNIFILKAKKISLKGK